MEPSTVLPATIDSTVSTGIGGLLPIIHPSQTSPIGKYGDNSDNETFEEWHEQFELVSAACGWSDRLKLANLSTRLHGQAYAFYRTCTSQQRSSYSELVAALKQRFVPVRIESLLLSILSMIGLHKRLVLQTFSPTYIHIQHR